MLTYFFLAACREVRAPTELPGLCTIAAQDRSPIVVALQYLSALLAGRSSRLVLLWLPAGCSGVDEWCEKYPRDAKLVRHLALIVSAWVYHRHHRVAMSFPFRLAALGIPGLAASNREVVAEQFFAKRSCCHRWGMVLCSGWLELACERNT